MSSVRNWQREGLVDVSAAHCPLLRYSVRSSRKNGIKHLEVLQFLTFYYMTRRISLRDGCPGKGWHCRIFYDQVQHRFTGLPRLSLKVWWMMRHFNHGVTKVTFPIGVLQVTGRLKLDSTIR